MFLFTVRLRDVLKKTPLSTFRFPISGYADDKKHDNTFTLGFAALLNHLFKELDQDDDVGTAVTSAEP